MPGCGRGNGIHMQVGSVMILQVLDQGRFRLVGLFNYILVSMASTGSSFNADGDYM